MQLLIHVWVLWELLLLLLLLLLLRSGLDPSVSLRIVGLSGLRVVGDVRWKRPSRIGVLKVRLLIATDLLLTVVGMRLETTVAGQVGHIAALPFLSNLATTTILSIWISFIEITCIFLILRELSLAALVGRLAGRELVVRMRLLMMLTLKLGPFIELVPDVFRLHGP